MKTIGLLGGMSWESTVPYYRLINRRIGERLGALHSAELVPYSVDFEPIEHLQHAGAWDAAAALLVRAAQSVEGAGADFLVICTNTMHKVYDQVAGGVGVPVLHIADATAQVIAAAGQKTVGLLGTRFTMEEDFYRGRLEEGHGLEVMVPAAGDRELVHRVIYEELCRGEVRDDSRREYARIIADLTRRGAGGVILGCTEIGLLVSPDDAAVPVYDTAAIHARAAADFALPTADR